LGLIFEKINGYKDGSFFTPGFITEYMARETIRRAVVQKFNEEKGWNLEDFEALKEHIDITKEGREEANRIINSLKICDPAVGSGHFLVSALNEMIALKSELKVLSYRDGKRMKLYSARVENDELIIEDEDEGGIFEYGLSKQGTIIPEKQAVQEAIFHEKQTIIENCLFGVDINANSVKICRLRLWIELLKHAYYHPSRTHAAPLPPEGGTANAQSSQTENVAELELQTLPNIDINIKAGNSLISRFGLNASLKSALKGTNWKIGDYRKFVNDYKNAQNKDDKNSLKELIDQIKKDFRTEITRDNPKQRKLNKLSQQLYDKYTGNKLFEEQLTKNQKQDRAKLEKEITKLQKEIDDLKNNEIYRNAFEWRFEFPEVLDDEGNFLGFDVVIGNPPYINIANMNKNERFFYKVYYSNVYKNKTDIFAFFIHKSINITNAINNICLIVPHTWLGTTSFLPLRKLLINKNKINQIVELDFKVFIEAIVKPIILQLDNKRKQVLEVLNRDFTKRVKVPYKAIKEDNELKINLYWSPQKHKLIYKIIQNGTDLGSIIRFTRGIKTSNDKKFLSKEKINDDYKKVIRGRNIKAYEVNHEGEYIWYRPDIMQEKAGALPHTAELFEVEEKLITQRVNSSGQLLVAYDNEKYFTLDTTNISDYRTKKYPEINLKYILALLNSKLINWWFNEIFKMPTISGYELHQIPIKFIKENQKPIINKVDQILQQKQQDPAADTSALEAEIDRMVYKLYGLTEEEVRIVEGSMKQ
jgi:hypothetical protein